MEKYRRKKRDVHILNEDGMVACNSRDRKAARRAAMGDIATTSDMANVTCTKCLEGLFRSARAEIGTSKR